MSNLVENVWIAKKVYDDAEEHYYSKLNKAALTPLAGEIAKARQKLIETRDTFNNDISNVSSLDVQAVKFIEKKVVELEKTLNTILDFMKVTEQRLETLEKLTKQVSSGGQTTHQIEIKSAPKVESVSKKDDDDDDVDLFGSDSEDDDEAAKIREERLAAYAAKKSKKPALIAKSNVILDVKPWDDETDMKKMEEEVRKIECDGLLWGAAKLQPLAYGIKKLQISAVVEDDKVSIDWLTEQIEALEDLVQSVDIAAFNKI